MFIAYHGNQGIFIADRNDLNRGGAGKAQKINANSGDTNFGDTLLNLVAVIYLYRDSILFEFIGK